MGKQLTTTEVNELLTVSGHIAKAEELLLEAIRTFPSGDYTLHREWSEAYRKLVNITAALHYVGGMLFVCSAPALIPHEPSPQGDPDGV
jgi:hypothetical protein